MGNRHYFSSTHLPLRFSQYDRNRTLSGGIRDKPRYHSMLLIHQRGVLGKESPAIRSWSSGGLGNRIDYYCFSLSNRTVLEGHHVYSFRIIFCWFSFSGALSAGDPNVSPEKTPRSSYCNSQQNG